MPEVSEMNNDLDVFTLIEAFGQRRKEFSMISAGLGGFLYSELSENDINKINQMFLAKQIKTRF